MDASSGGDAESSDEWTSSDSLVSEIETDLARCREQLLATRRHQAAFVANVSRELRTPLDAIHSTSELLANSDLPATKALLADAILWRASTLRRVVDDLLEYQQLRLGDIRLVDEAVDLADLVDRVIAEARVHLIPGVSITSEHDDRAPRSIRADGVRLAHAVFHLVSNACKYTSFGSVQVAVRPAATSGRVRIEVRDTGQGISETDLDRLFEPYERGSSHRSTGGLGLGLPIARGLARAMGGSIGVSSRPAIGSSFWVELPVGPGLGASASTDSAIRVLLVDADEVHRTVTTRQLQQLDVDVDVVVDGEDALIRLETETVDFLLVDVHLPGISGLEVARRCRRSIPRPYIAGISSASTAVERAACFEAGMDAFVPKTATLDDVRSVIDAARRHRVRQQ